MTPPGQGTLFIYRDLSSGNSFLVDTGAAVSVFPASGQDRATQSSTSVLVAANGTPIETYGQRPIQVTVGRHSTTWPFLLARVTRPILGADFLRHTGFLVDVRGKRLVQTETWDTARLQPAIGTHQLFHLREPEGEYLEWIKASYPELLIPKFSEPTSKHGVVLQIPTTGRPVFARARRLPPDKLAAAKSAFEDMSRTGVVRRSKSAWSSPLHMVPKEDGTWRPCGDFRRLNEATDTDKYPVPHLQDFSAQLQGCTVFSKVDLVRGYHQIPVAAEDVHKTAVITPFGLYEFLRMPFGLKNAAQAFQRLMDTVCQGLDFVFVYLDDVLVASKTTEEHRVHLAKLFVRFQDFGLVLNPAKCVFAQPQLKFLGHRVSAHGIEPAADRVKAIRVFPQPRTVRQLMEFLGMLNFYKRFIPGAATLLSPLYDATAGASSKSQLQREVEWTTPMIRAFREAKTRLANAALLAHFVPGAEMALTTDASDFAVGAVLEQKVAGSWRPLAFYSSRFKPSRTETSRPMQLADAQRSATERELLAAYRAVLHFQHILEGRPFTLFTDHRPLIGMMAKATEPKSAMQARHLALISSYTTDIRHIEGKVNAVADALSRIEIDEISLGVDYRELAQAQCRDPEMPAVRTATTALRWRDIDIGGVQLLCDVSGKRPRPWVPASFRRPVFDQLHGLAHPGIRASVRLLSSRFVWYGINRDVTAWARTCIACQRAKVHRHTVSGTDRIAVPDSRFEALHVDLVGPFPPSQGCTHLLTVVDRFTRWPEALPISDTSTQGVAMALISGWVARFGVPAVLISDRGPQFISQLWAEIAKLLGVQLRQTTAYHPQSNGMVERFHRQLKASLSARLTGPNWVGQLPWVLLGIRAAHKMDIGASPAELVYGTELHLPGQFRTPTTAHSAVTPFLEDLRKAMADLRPTPTAHHQPQAPNPTRVPEELRRCPMVFVRRDGHRTPLSAKYDGPFQVVTREEKFFKVQLGDREDTVAIDRLKPAMVEDDAPPAQPPRRGRPPSRPMPPSAQSLGTPVVPPAQEPSSEPSHPKESRRSGRTIHPPRRYT